MDGPWAQPIPAADLDFGFCQMRTLQVISPRITGSRNCLAKTIGPFPYPIG